MTTTAEGAVQEAGSTPGPADPVLALVAGSDPVAWDERGLHLVTQTDRLLVVESGQVDVFAVRLSDGIPRGAWRSLTRLGRGDVLTAPGSGPEHRMLCRQVGAAVVRSVPVAHLPAAIEAARAGGPTRGLRTLARGIDSGVRKMASHLRHGVPPRDFTALQYSSALELRGRDVARSVQEVLWVDLRAGDLELEGQTTGPVTAPDSFCLTRQDWLTVVSPSARMATLSTLESLVRQDLAARLLRHWTVFLGSVDRVVREEAAEADARLDRISARDEEALRTVRQEYDLLLETESNRRLPSRSGVSSDHVDAVVHALRALRADAEAPEAVRQRRDITDFDALGAESWVRTREIRLDGAWWRRPMGPFVGYWGPERLPVAFVPADGGYIVRGSRFERPVRVTEENRSSAGKAGWVVYPRLPEHITTTAGLFRYGAAGLRGAFWLFGAMALLVGALGLLTPILNGQVLGAFVASANRPMIIQAGLAVIASAVVAGAFSVVQNLVILHIQGALTAKTQTAVWGRLMDLPVTFYQRFSTGRLGTVVLSVKAAEDMLSGVVVAAVLGLIVAAANLVVILSVHPTLGGVGIGLTAVAVVVCGLVGRNVLRAERERHAEEQRLNAVAYETLTAMPKIRGAAAEERMFLRWSERQREVQERTLASRRLQDSVVVFNGLYPMVALGVVFWTAHALGDVVPLPALLTFMTAFTLLLNAVLQFTGCVLSASAMLPLLDSLTPILEAAPETGLRPAHPGDLAGGVALRQVTFRYGADGPMVLEDVSIEATPGEFVALVGPSGSGKSSVVRLLLGFEHPEGGSVLVDGQDLHELDLSAVRRQFGVVLQSGALLPGDIRDNIAGGGRYSEAEIWEAAEMAGLADDIRALPMGLSTVVNETSEGLSGGQVQRLMIARALVSKPRLVIFDEATSALDNPTQRLVAEATRQLNATRVVVAHRLSTVRDADRIYVMDRGRVVQTGTYEELMEDDDGLFAALARQQGTAG